MTASTSSASSSCAVCGSAHTEPYVEKNGYAFRKCTGCGYVFCDPRPSQDELDKWYGVSGGTEGVNRDNYPKSSSRKRRAFFNALKLAPHVWGKRALDIGCGGGFVVGAMKMVGAKAAFGLDLNPKAIDYAQAHYPGCAFHCGGFDAFADGSLGRFGFVYSSEVIEHVLDVEAYLKFLVQVTEPGAKVFITTPDIASAQVPDDVTEWSVFAPPMHIQFFTQATLTHLFGRFGFTPVKRVADRGGAGLKMLFRKVA